MRETIRKHPRFFLFFTAAGLLLRLIFLLRFPNVANDSQVYGDIAKNWLMHGVYGLSSPAGIVPTYIRLPGYPAFLAFIFAVFGVEHYRAALVAQVFIDLGTCFLCADMSRRILGERPAKAAFVLAVLCPFFANYSAAALTETLEVFFTALALNFAITAWAGDKLRMWVGCGLSCAAAILLRPDGVLLPLSIAAYTGGEAVFSRSVFSRRTAASIVLVGLAFAPLVPWTLRNWRTFHRFQALAPRYANEENEFVPQGFNRWTRTWIADYVSVEEIYWQVPGSEMDPAKLPSRAFDSAEQRERTEQLISDYNQVLHVTPELDRGFEELASARIHAHPLRYAVGLPLLRILDMWLRPRTEMLPSDSRWWEFNDDPKWSVLAVVLGGINLGYVLCAFAGWIRVPRVGPYLLFTLFVLLRSAFLGTLENPEPRYTLEMFPVVIVFAAACLAAARNSRPERDSIA